MHVNSRQYAGNFVFQGRLDYIDAHHPHVSSEEIRHLADLQFFINKLQVMKEKYHILAPDIVMTLGAYREHELIFGNID